MSYFKTHQSKAINRPIVHQVLLVQIVVTVCVSLLAMLFAINTGFTVLLGGLISIGGQAYYNFQALRQFGSRSTANVIAATYRAMWGKWLIIISISVVAVLRINELNAGVLFASVFVVHTLGALLLPILVKRVAQ